MRYCDNCGNKIEDGLQFCDQCGNKIEYEIEEQIDAELVDAEEDASSEIKEKSSNSNIIIALIVIVIILVICIFYIITNQPTAKNLESDSQEITDEILSEEFSSEEITTEEITTEEQTTQEETTEHEGEKQDNIYSNDTFGYSMLIPEGFEIVEEFNENDVNEGVMLSDGSGGQIEIRGTDYTDNIHSAEDVMIAYGASGVTWSDMGDDYCCYSYNENGVVGYIGCYFNSDKVISVHFQYIVDYERPEYSMVAETLFEYISSGKPLK